MVWRDRARELEVAVRRWRSSNIPSKPDLGALFRDRISHVFGDRLERATRSSYRLWFLVRPPIAFYVRTSAVNCGWLDGFLQRNVAKGRPTSLSVSPTLMPPMYMFLVSILQGGLFSRLPSTLVSIFTLYRLGLCYLPLPISTKTHKNSTRNKMVPKKNFRNTRLIVLSNVSLPKNNVVLSSAKFP